MRDTRRVIRLENFHDLPVRLLHGPSGPRAGVSSQPPTQLPEGPQEQDRHVTVCPPKGRSAVRQAGTVMSVYRDLGVSADTAHQEAPPLPQSAVEQELVARLAAAFEGGDVQGVVSLLTEDAWVRMPPLPLEYQGRELAAKFFASSFREGRK